MLEGGDERQADRVSCLGDLRGVTLGGTDPGVGDGLDPGRLGQPGRERRVGGRRWPEVHRTGASLGTAEHVEAHVGRDAVHPGSQAGSALETLDAPPRPHHRLLDGVLGFEPRSEHPVAVAGELSAVGLELDLDAAGLDRGVAGHG
jgi:hypothetical protein